MPLYYFNVYNDDTTLDDEGAELADEHAARAHAVKAARSLAAETALHGHLIGHHRVEYVDADQNPLGEVRFDEAVEVRP
jgi:imidazolonepropionase-like amidohydrolase